MPIFASPHTGKKPRISPNAFVAETATIIGDVIIESGANIWYGALIRGDYCTIKIGKNTSIQDNCVVHSEAGTTCIIKDNIVVGHCAIVHGPCTVEDNCLIGINSVVLQNTTVGMGCVIAAGAIARKQIAPMSMMVGTPAVLKKTLTKDDMSEAEMAAKAYAQNGKKFREAGRNHPGIEEFMDASL